MEMTLKIPLFLAVIGAAIFAYGWSIAPEVLTVIELLQMQEALQQAYYTEANRATFMQLSGCVLAGVGLISFVIIRSIKIHKKVPK